MNGRVGAPAWPLGAPHAGLAVCAPSKVMKTTNCTTFCGLHGTCARLPPSNANSLCEADITVQPAPITKPRDVPVRPCLRGTLPHAWGPGHASSAAEQATLWSAASRKLAAAQGFCCKVGLASRGF